MDIVNFFETLAGKWFSQRTTHSLADQSSLAGQSNLVIDFLSASDPSLSDLCQSLGQTSQAITSQIIICGLRIDQESRLSETAAPVKRTSVMVILAPDQDGQGLIVQSHGNLPCTTSQYHLADQVLTLTTPTATGSIEERLWFAHPNLRLRTSVITVGERVDRTCFCSEIRLGVSS
ncbi:MAG: phycobiliprotein lyase [Cyanobacteria bacterium REEB459]|nr:phycobiliprotein lyase [Cyanobacteria bacterium REEB459]